VEGVGASEHANMMLKWFYDNDKCVHVVHNLNINNFHNFFLAFQPMIFISKFQERALATIINVAKPYMVGYEVSIQFYTNSSNFGDYIQFL
jgi:hypothetical protein